MKNNVSFEGYVAPIVEVVEVEVEKGFAASGARTTENYEDAEW